MLNSERFAQLLNMTVKFIAISLRTYDVLISIPTVFEKLQFSRPGVSNHHNEVRDLLKLSPEFFTELAAWTQPGRSSKACSPSNPAWTALAPSSWTLSTRILATTVPAPARAPWTCGPTTPLTTACSLAAPGGNLTCSLLKVRFFLQLLYIPWIN